MSQTPDPTDAKADGNFGSAGSHRTGYANDKLANAEYWARKGGTLNAGEGLILCDEIDRLRWEVAWLKFSPQIRQVATTLNDVAEQFFKRQKEGA